MVVTSDATTPALTSERDGDFASTEPAVPTNVTSGIARQHFLYSSELSLLAETESAVVAPGIAHEYVWFGDEPLVQVAASGVIS